MEMITIPAILPTSERERKEVAKRLRKLADELDPPAGPIRKQIPPSVDMVRDYCDQRNNGIDAEAFVDFYESKGWLVGKARMRDWQCAVRNAERGGYFRGANNGDGNDWDQRRQSASLAAIAKAAGTGESVELSLSDEASGDVHGGGGGLLGAGSGLLPFGDS